jgi:hypothetical protein
MIFLYTVVVVVLFVVRLFVKWRASSLEKRYTRIAAEADKLVRQVSFKEGNASRPDPAQSARRQYELGQLVQKRDRVEALYTRWQNRADRLSRWLKGVRDWKGKKLPYTAGVIDLALVLVLVDWLGAGQYVNAHGLYDWVRSWFVQ